MKRPLFPIIIILSMLLTLSGPFQIAQASQSYPSPDLDQDGLSNVMETTGWYNLAGGPYITNPNRADTDSDGLTDSQEKMFNTNPVDPNSPGISVTYQSSFKTFEYYSATDPAYLKMSQGGSQYLLTEGAVLRRGTSFKINADSAKTATLTVSGPGLTPLTPVRDIARGGWNVSIPATGTVGTYTAKVTDGAFTKSMPIYVIFELPAGLTPAQTSAYVYDDDPANKRDEVAVWWRAVDWKYYNADKELYADSPCLPGDAICSAWQYHTVSGYAQAFWTEQFTKNVLVVNTMPVIQGLTTPYDAAAAIGVQADRITRVDFSSVKNSFSSATATFYDPIANPALPWSSNGGGCETSAGVLTSQLRSVGIAARPLVMDYNKTVGHEEEGNFSQYEYDTAVMMWVQGPTVAQNVWYADRSFNNAEDRDQTQPVWASGTTGLKLLSDIGVYDLVNTGRMFKHFQDTFSDAVQSANENWDFQNADLGGGMVNTVWVSNDIPASEFVPANRDFKWNSKYPLQIQQSPFIDFFNCQLWHGDNWAPSEWYAVGNPLYKSNPTGRTAATTYNLPVGIPTSPGNIENWPYNPKTASCSASTTPEACAAFTLTWQNSCVALPGQTIANNTPTPAAQLGSAALNQTYADPALAFEMAAYQPGTTTVQPAKIVGSYSYTSKTTNGLVDAVTISVPLNITVPGAYNVEADLYDAQGAFVGHAVWNGSGSTASLDYQVAGTLPPYSLQHLNLNDGRGKQLEANYAPVYKITDLGGKVAQASVGFGNSTTVLGPQTVVPAGTFSAVLVDTNASTLADRVDVSTTVNVSVAGNYWMEGLLVNSQNMPVAWSTSAPQALTASAGQTLHMSFDGRMLYDQMPINNSQQFTLTAVKIFSGTPALATLEASLPVTTFITDPYSRFQFDPSNPGYTLFQDDMEASPSNWTIAPTSQWALANNPDLSHSGTHSWIATGAASTNGLLTFATPVDFTALAGPWLRFTTAYQMLNGQSALVEISVGGGSWTTLKTYTGSTTNWSTEMIDLSAYAPAANVSIRFNAQNNPGLIWSVDDVYVIAGPIISSASFIHSTPIKAMVPATLTASYVATNKTLPITYLWDFCGVAKETTTPTILYRFTSGGTCQVKVTVTNNFGSAVSTTQALTIAPPAASVFLPLIIR